VNSVGSRGDSYDNALAESINGLYKTELVRNEGSWRGLDDLELATLEWVDWFNHRRLFEAHGHTRQPNTKPRTTINNTQTDRPTELCGNLVFDTLK